MNKNNNYFCLATSFSIKEQIYAQITFNGFWGFGFLGIILQDWKWAIIYLFIVACGILGLVQRHLTCPRCPHLHVHGSCLQLHPKITKLLIKEQKNNPFSLNEKILFVSIFLLITIFPIYWLKNNIWFLTGFLLFGSMWYLGQFLYFCKRCRVSSCPFNKTKK
ncbi:MAG: hypothetical protein ABII25_07970 [bacterium]